MARMQMVSSNFDDIVLSPSPQCRLRLEFSLPGLRARAQISLSPIQHPMPLWLSLSPSGRPHLASQAVA